MQRVKQGDTVEVIAGKDKGLTWRSCARYSRRKTV